MSAISDSLRLRPTRIGFLVDPNDLESLRRIFQVCTRSWGGVFNPIIPVCSVIPEVWTDPLFPAPSPTELAQGYLVRRPGDSPRVSLRGSTSRSKLKFAQSDLLEAKWKHAGWPHVSQLTGFPEADRPPSKASRQYSRHTAE